MSEQTESQNGEPTEKPLRRERNRERSRKRREKMMENRRKVMALVLSGKTRNEIAAETGLALSSLSAILQRAGFPLAANGQGQGIRVNVWVPVRQLRVMRRLSSDTGGSVSALLGRIIGEIEEAGIDETRRWLGKLAKPARSKKVKSPKPMNDR